MESSSIYYALILDNHPDNFSPSQHKSIKAESISYAQVTRWKITQTHSDFVFRNDVEHNTSPKPRSERHSSGWKKNQFWRFTSFALCSPLRLARCFVKTFLKASMFASIFVAFKLLVILNVSCFHNKFSSIAREQIWHLSRRPEKV